MSAQPFDMEKRWAELLAADPCGFRRVALKLAREAADARAEEIAKLLERDLSLYRAGAAEIARSTITKPEALRADAMHSSLPHSNPVWDYDDCKPPGEPSLDGKAFTMMPAIPNGPLYPSEAAIRADEREKIRAWVRRQPTPERQPFTFLVTEHAMCVGGPLSEPKPDAREAVLEKALRKARDDIEAGNWPDLPAMSDALDYKEPK